MGTKTASKRNGEIDLLRFIFCIIIVLYHFYESFHQDCAVNGWIGVEFFFLTSGFLMAKSASKMRGQQLNGTQIANQSWNFIFKKLKSFYLYYFSAIILQILIRQIIVNHVSLGSIINKFTTSISTFSLLFMETSQYPWTFYVGNTWYLSAMLISMFLLFPLLIKSFDFSCKILFPILSIFLLGYFYNTFDTLSIWKEWMSICASSVVRATGEIALGCALFGMYESISFNKKYLALNYSMPAKVLFTLIKLISYVVILRFALSDLSEKHSIHALFFCAVGVLGSFLSAGYTIPDSAVTRFLGKVSLPIFIYHGFIRQTLEDILGENISVPLFWILVIGSIITSILLMYLMDFLWAKTKKLFAPYFEKVFSQADHAE